MSAKQKIGSAEMKVEKETLRESPLEVPESLQDAKLIDIDAVAALVNYSVRTIRRWAKNGQMPRPVRPGGGQLRFRLSEILKWIANGCPSMGEGAV